MNPLLLIDGYKIDHRRQYSPGISRIYSNFTPRGNRRVMNPRVKGVVVFGLQYFIQKYLIDDMYTYFFSRDKADVLQEYKDLIDGYLGPNDVGTAHIAALHDLGYIPLEIKALPEGTLCPTRVPVCTIENTLPEFFWLVNYIETVMSNIIWKPMTSATTAYNYRRMLDDHSRKTVGDTSFVQWQGHDFSMRGMSGIEDACTSAAGHLTSFTGTDTLPSIPFVNRYYGGTANGLIGGSVAATEHSVIMAGGDQNELDTFNHILDIYPGGIVSIVSDTWSIWNVIGNILPRLKDRIMKRNGKVVIRPDSGDPVKIVCGDPAAPGDTPEAKGVVELLWDLFGGEVNQFGYKVLDSHIGAIYGDAITYERADEICKNLAAKGFASTNIVFGIGSFTYEYVTRDTHGFAMKATYAEVNGVGRALWKKPVTDTGEKHSATGRLKVVENTTGDLELVQNCETGLDTRPDVMNVVFKDGVIRNRQTFADIRARLAVF